MLKPLTEKDFVLFSKTFKQALSSFITISQAHKIETILMTQPSRFTLPNTIPYDDRQLTYKQYRYLHRSFNQQIRDVANEYDLNLIDLENLVPQSNKYMFDRIHFNNAGSVFASNIISKHFTKNLKNK